MTARILLLLGVALFAGVSWVFSCEAQRLQTLTERVGVLDPRHFETLTLVTAGTGAAQEDPDRLGPLLVIGAQDRAVLVDVGRAPAEALRRAKLPLGQPDTVFLTSLLPENVAGLGELLLTGWAAPRTKPLRVVGPTGTKALAAALEEAFSAGINATANGLSQPRDGVRIEAIDIGDGWSEDRDGLRVRAAALVGGPLPALAYRFESSDRAIVVNGAGWGAEQVVSLAQGADLLVQDAMHTPTIEHAIAAGGPEGARIAKESVWHTQAAAAGDLATRAGVRKLVLVRLRPPPLHDRQYVNLVREKFAGSVLIAEDGDEVTR